MSWSGRARVFYQTMFGMCARPLFNFFEPQLHHEDFLVPSHFIIKQWQLHKFTSENTMRELLRTKEPKARHLMDYVQWWELQKVTAAHKVEIDALNLTLNSQLSDFRHSPVIDSWQRQYDQNCKGKLHRFKSLLFLGGSEQGKSQKAKSIFGPERTLVVNCQGLGSALPSLRGFDRATHRAILFDEGNEQQVLQNKLLFQAGPNSVALSQSVCNQHRYEIFIYQVAIIICSNRFQLVPDGTVTAEDSECLNKNIIVAKLPAGEKWYIDQ